MPRPAPALDFDLIARAHRDIVVDDASALRLLTDDELRPGLARIIAGRRAQESLWVFGYGSLMWKPEFEALERRIGTARGYHRRFCLLQRRFRGTPERPGVVLALEPGGSCRGVAFRIPGDDPHVTLMPVWRREMRGRGYLARWLKIETAEGPITALSFLANRGSERYTGRLDEPSIADWIASGCGNQGTSAEYLLNTVVACAELGIHDRHLWALQALVAERLRARCGAGSRG